MAERVYIETTVVSYLTARPSRDLIIAAHQQITHDWWSTCRAHYELCVSELVLDEAAAGDAQAAAERLVILQPMLVIETTKEALELAGELLRAGALPDKAADDAMRVAAQKVYAWVEDSCYPIRPQVQHPSMSRGSFHILADSLRVGWHPQFVDRLRHLLEPREAS